MGSYVISDIHGCYDELIRMLEKINLEDSDTLICAGDYVDKGPKNAEVLEWIMNVQLHFQVNKKSFIRHIHRD